MSTPTPHILTERHAVESNDREPKARRAVAEFRRMLPMLNGYARSLTGNRKVRVEISATMVSATDGTTIFMRPPLALGEHVTHDRRWCDRRDEGKMQICPACKQREDILIKLYHEIAHIAGKSFMMPSEAHIKRILSDAAMAGGSKIAADMRKRMTEQSMKWKSYVEMANAMNPWLSFLLNVLEDARIDSDMFAARPGTKVMYEGMLNAIREEGIEQRNSEGQIVMVPWSEMPMNAQAIASLYDVFADFDMAGFYHPDITEVMDDSEIADLISTARESTDAGQIYEASFPILERLRALGYCKLPDEEPEPEENDEDDGDDGEGDTGEADGDDTSPGSDEGDHSQGDGNEDDSSSDREAGDDGKAGDDSDSDGGDDRDSDGEAGSSDLPTDDAEGSGEPDEGDVDASAEDSTPEDQNPDADPGAGAGGSPDEVPGRSDGGDQSSDDGAGEPTDHDRDTTDGSGRFRHDDATPTPPEPGDSDDAGAGSESGTDADSADLAEESSDGDDVRDRPDDGTPDQVAILIIQIDGHTGKEGESEDISITSLTGDELPEDIQAIVTAVVQGMFFDQPSHAINGVRTHKFDQPVYTGSHNMSSGFGIDPTDVAAPEGVLGRALMRMRAAFSANSMRGHQRNLKSGRIAGRTLARRAPFDDPRMFQKRTRITKRDYFVLIGLDISGSTAAESNYTPGKGYTELDEPVIETIKRAAMAQADLCSRLGVDFAVYAHTGGPESFAGWDEDYGRDAGWMVEIYEIKAPNEPWNENAKNRLRCLKPSMANLDGHTLEHYRKVLDRQIQTDKVIMYYTDGAMPAENYDEELEVLQREIEQCKRRGYTLMAVGVGNDDPLKYGLDMCRLDDDDDIIKVVEHLERRLATA
jgi:hypothetical protein